MRFLLTALLLATLPAFSHASEPMTGWATGSDELAQAWAPVLLQENRFRGDNRTQDLPVAFDFDGDWDARNNWQNQPEHTAAAEPVVHYALVATERRAYLTYYLFYPRDWAKLCVPMVCHENDLEQFTLVIENDGSDRGRLLLMDAKFHRSDRGYPAPDSEAKCVDDSGAKLSLTDDGRPLLRVEWGGHGVTTCDMDGDGKRDPGCVSPKEDVWQLLPPGASPVALKKPADERPYRLAPLAQTLWKQRHASAGIWAEEAFRYEGARLGKIGGDIGVSFAGSRGGARAPWGVRPKGNAAAGDRFFDPALHIADRWKLPGGADGTDYVEHPFLSDLTTECATSNCWPQGSPPSTRQAVAAP